MTRLNLEEQSLAINLCNINENNAVKVAKILSEMTGAQIDPGIVRRVLRKNNIEVNHPGRPQVADDSELERCFNKYSPREDYISHAAQ